MKAVALAAVALTSFAAAAGLHEEFVNPPKGYGEVPGLIGPVKLLVR